MDSFADIMRGEISQLDDTDLEWVQYVKDHRALLLENASRVSIPPATMFTYRYRMRALLTHLKFKPELTWLVMWLNQLDTPADVVGLSELIIPSKEQVDDLSQDYASYQLKINQLNEA